MATFNIVLDKRNKKKNNTYNLSVRVINVKDVIYVPIAPMTVMQYNHVFVKKAVDEKSIEFREQCNKFLTKCERIYAELKPFNIKLFRQKVKEKEEDKIPLDGKISDLFDHYIQVKDLKSKTKSHYQTTSNILMTYKNGLTIYDITTKFLKQFEKKYMRNNISLATIGSYLRNLRSVINFAMDTEGLIHSSYKYPFGKGGYQIKGYFPSKTALTKNEIDFIVNFENYKSKDQEYAMCIWKILYYLNGSNFVDLLRLKWSDIKGQKIVFVRKKTEFTRTNNVRPVEVPFFPELQSLFEQIGIKSSSYVLGKIDESYSEKKLSNKSDKMKKMINRELSDFSNEFKLSVDLKIKSARDCFASSLYRSDVSIVKISKMLNHSNTVVTEHYLTGLGTDELFDINEHLCRKNVN